MEAHEGEILSSLLTPENPPFPGTLDFVGSRSSLGQVDTVKMREKHAMPGKAGHSGYSVCLQGPKAHTHNVRKTSAEWL